MIDRYEILTAKGHRLRRTTTIISDTGISNKKRQVLLLMKSRHLANVFLSNDLHPRPVVVPVEADAAVVEFSQTVFGEDLFFCAGGAHDAVFEYGDMGDKRHDFF